MKIIPLPRAILSVLVLLLLCILSVQARESSEQTVFRDIKFGDSQRTVRRKVLADTFFSVPMVNRGGEALSPKGDVDLRIEGTPLDLVFFFNRQNFYRLDASTKTVPEDQFDSTLQKHRDRLQNFMKKGYGDPFLTQRQEPEDVTSGNFVTVAYWKNEDLEENRTIWVGVSGKDSGYQASLIVQDPTRTDAGSYQSNSSIPRVSVDEASEHF